MKNKRVAIHVSPNFRKFIKKRAADKDISVIKLTDIIAKKNTKKSREYDEIDMFW